MIYFTGVNTLETQAVARLRADLGLMIQPRNPCHQDLHLYPCFAVDNDCYGAKFNPGRWLRCLDWAAEWQERCLFATAPDVVCDHPATLELWHLWHHEITDRGLPAAFVCQNGSTPDDVPDCGDVQAVFIGGDDLWKLSHYAGAQIAAAKARGRWTHVGRVNAGVRFGSVRIMGADSADGNLVKYGPRAEMIRQLLAMLDQPPQLEFVP